MSSINRRTISYRTMVIFAIGAGVTGIALQFLPGMEFLAFMLSMAVLGGLIGGSNGYTARARQQLSLSYKAAFEGLLLIVLTAYAALELARWAGFAVVENFINTHWPGLLAAAMCLLMGIAGLRNRREPGIG